jgi:hypothetical protein
LKRKGNGLCRGYKTFTLSTIVLLIACISGYVQRVNPYGWILKKARFILAGEKPAKPL